MAQFDPTQKFETWLMMKAAKTDRLGKECLRRLKFNLVEYDGSPELAFEPVNHLPYLHDDTGLSVVNPISTGSGICNKLEILEGQPWQEWMRID